MDLELLNGAPKCMLLESFIGKVVIVQRAFRREFDRLEEAMSFIKEKGWEVNISYIKGSKVMRDLKGG